MRTNTRTTIAIFLMAVLGVVCGIYLGMRYRPRSHGTQVARQPSVAGQPPAAPPSAVPAAPARGPAPTSASHPPPAPPATKSKAHVPAAVHGSVKTAKIRAAPRRIAHGVPSGKKHAAAASQRSSAARARPVTKIAGRRVPEKHLPTARVVSAPPRLVPHLEGLASAGTSLRVPSHRLARARGGKPLRRVGTMSPVRALPEPRRVRQERVARAMAASRQRWAQVATRRRRATRHRARPSPIPSLEPAFALGPRIHPATRVASARSAISPAGRLPPAVRARLLARAAQRVRYIEQAVVLEGQPATLATYVVWEHGKPRTFSFVRQDRRTDQARIVRVNEAARQVTALVLARGAVVQAVVPVEAVVAYGQALQTDPPSPELLARADALLSPGAVVGPPPPPVASLPPVERVAGMRELVGQVRRVDPASRLVRLSGPEGKTPFRVPEGTEMPKVGDIITITVPMDGQISPQPMTMYTPLQPTVAGVVTRVRPTAVELIVQTVTPEGRIIEVPVPVTGDARVFISGQPGDLRALKAGFYIRAYMTPSGETRILGAPSEEVRR